MDLIIRAVDYKILHHVMLRPGLTAERLWQNLDMKQNTLYTRMRKLRGYGFVEFDESVYTPKLYALHTYRLTDAGHHAIMLMDKIANHMRRE